MSDIIKSEDGVGRGKRREVVVRRLRSGDHAIEDALTGDVLIYGFETAEDARCWVSQTSWSLVQSRPPELPPPSGEVVLC